MVEMQSDLEAESNVGVQPPPKAVGWNNGLATLRLQATLDAVG